MNTEGVRLLTAKTEFGLVKHQLWYSVWGRTFPHQRGENPGTWKQSSKIPDRAQRSRELQRRY